MDLLILSPEREGEVTHLDIQNPVKFIDYGNNFIVLVTVYGEMFYFGDHKPGLHLVNDLPFNKIKHLSCGNDQVVLVNENNEICIGTYFGDGFVFKKLGSCKDKIKLLRSGNDFFIFVMNNNSLYGHGNNVNGQLGCSSDNNELNEITKIEFNNKGIKDVQCGDNHSILLDIFGNVYTTGENENGQLGFSSYEEQSFEFVKVDLPFNVIKIFADNYVSFIVNEFNELYGTGFNNAGQLGLGHSQDKHVFSKIIFYEKINNFNFYFSYQDGTFITDDENNIYTSGGFSYSVKYLGIDIESNSCLDKFVKLNNVNLLKEIKRKYRMIFPMDIITVIISSNYNVSLEEDFNNLKLKCLQKLNNNQLCDLIIYTILD